MFKKINSNFFRGVVFALCVTGAGRSFPAEMVDDLTVGVEEGPLESGRKNAGKSGIYVRLTHSERDKSAEYVLSHPLVDAVVMSFYWNEVEPASGHFDFSSLDRMLDLCKRYKKGMVLELSVYGGEGEKTSAPEWLYETGIRRIAFSEQRDARPRELAMPKVWDNPCTEALNKCVRRLGERYQHEQALWYVVPAFGFNGGPGIFPTRDGSGIAACRKEGWTIDVWRDLCNKVTGFYQLAFPDTPLLMTLPRHARYELAQNQWRDIGAALARRGVSFVPFGLEADLEKHKKNNGMIFLEPFSRYADKGALRVGLGDDNPLWLPAERRTRDSTADRDEEGLKRIVEHAFGGVAELPKTHITILFISYAEIEYSHPKGKAPNKAVFDILQKARDRLREEDKNLFK